MKRKSGRHPLEIRSVEKSYDGLKVIRVFPRAGPGKNRAYGRKRHRQTTLLKSLIRNATGFIEGLRPPLPTTAGVRWGTSGRGYFGAGPRRIHHQA